MHESTPAPTAPTIPVRMLELANGDLVPIRRPELGEVYDDLSSMLFTEYGGHERISEVMALYRAQVEDDSDEVRPQRFHLPDLYDEETDTRKQRYERVLPHSAEMLEDLQQSGGLRQKTEQERYEDDLIKAGLEPTLERLTQAQQDAVRLVWADGMTLRAAASLVRITFQSLHERLRTAYRRIRGEFSEACASYADVRQEIRRRGLEAGEVIKPTPGQPATVMPDEAKAIERITSFEDSLLDHVCDVACQKTDSKVAARSSSAELFTVGDMLLLFGGVCGGCGDTIGKGGEDAVVMSGKALCKWCAHDEEVDRC